MPCLEMVYTNKRRWSIGQQPETKSVGGYSNKPISNWSSCSPIRFTWNSVCSCLRRTSKRVVPGAVQCKMDACFLGAPTCCRATPLCLAPPRPIPIRPARIAAVRRPAQPRPCYVWLVASKNGRTYLIPWKQHNARTCLA